MRTQNVYAYLFERGFGGRLAEINYLFENDISLVGVQPVLLPALGPEVTASAVTIFIPFSSTEISVLSPLTSFYPGLVATLG